MRNISFLGPAVLALFALSAQAQDSSRVAFLGADPQFVTPAPVPADHLSGGGIDAAGNGYYANSASGTVVRLDTNGTLSTLLTGLKQPHVAVDYKGDLFVADTGNNRLLSLPVNASKPRTIPGVTAPGGIAADVSDNFFFLSSDNLYEVIRQGQPRKIGAFPGATLIAYGPATGENDTLYILSKPGVPSTLAKTTGVGTFYRVSTYTYHNATGVTASGQTFQTTDSIEDFGVDAEGNLIFAAVQNSSGQPQTYLFEITPAGEKFALTSPVNGSSIRLALNYNRTIYYEDAQGVFSLMKGAVDFGSATQAGGAGSPNTLTLNFSLPAGVAVAKTTYTVDGAVSGDFEDGFPFGANCNPGAVCSIPVSYLPQDVGITGADMALLDENGATLAQVRLHGIGVFPIHQLYAANNVATAFPPDGVSLKEPAGICNSTSLGPMITDVALGSVLTPYSSAVDMSGLGKPETVAHIPTGNIYATQAGMAGVLSIGTDGTRTHVATRLATEPNGVAVDGAGNIYISDHNSIFRLGVDGTETELASPETDDNYRGVQSIAVDPAGMVYAYFGEAGASGKGGLLKVAPNGAATPLATDAASAAGLALDSGGGLYFTDGVNKTLSTQRTDGTWMTMLSGLGQPKGVTALYGPLLVDQGTAQLVSPTLPSSAFDFGNVPVGTTATKTFIVYALGNAQTTGQLEFEGFDSSFSAGSSYVVDPGGSQTVTITFTPSYPGPHSSTLDDLANDYYSTNPFPIQYTVTGVGVEP